MTSIRPGGPMEQGEWDDNRLETAFAARAAMAPSAPPDVAAEVLARLTSSRRALPRWPTFAVAAAAVALVVALGGSTILRQVQPSPSGPSGAGSGNPSNSGGATGPVLEALGEPISVTAALAVRASGRPGREIVVAGFLSPFRAIPCAYMPGPDNPAFLRCPATMQWLMEQSEDLWTVGPNEVDGHPPTSPAFHPSFALVDQPATATVDAQDPAVVPVVLMGHFDDRRAPLCDAPNVDACSQTFMVDRVLSVNGTEQPVMTSRSSASPASDLAQDVDAMVAGVAPNAIVESRQLIEVGQLFAIEPILRQDPTLRAWSDQLARVWLVTAVDLRDGMPTPRTFALLDGSDWFAEVTPDGATMLERTQPTPSGDVPAAPSTDPAAFAGAPTSVLGIPVRDIATIERDRQAAVDSLGRDELAIRAWYVAPDPAATCPEQLPTIHPPTPPCDEARHWLLQDPLQYGVERGQLRRDPSTDHYPPVLNPLLPVDVAFNVGQTWSGETPLFTPVVVLGHFEDERVDTYAGNLYFVIDALAWMPERPAASLDSVVRLTANATEDVASVLARIEAVSPNDAVGTWATVVKAADFPLLDPRAESMPEFAEGPPIWILRRLIHGERDGRQRLAVEWAWTAERGSRVWWTDTPDSPPDLGTHIRLDAVDAHTAVVRIFDYDQLVASARAAEGYGQLTWQRAGDPRWSVVDVARGHSRNEVVVRWTAGSCDPDWDVRIGRTTDGGIKIQPVTSGDYCPEDAVVRRIVIVFDREVDLDRITSGEECCG